MSSATSSDRQQLDATLLTLYDIGRKLNEADWELTHFAFCGFKQSGKNFRRLLDEIGALAKILVPASEYYDFEHRFRAIASDTYDYYRETDFTASMRCNVNEQLAMRDLNHVLEPSDLESARDQLRCDAVQCARRLLLEKCDGQAARMILLGERVDQGVRPTTLEHHLYRPSSTLVTPGEIWIDETNFGRLLPAGLLNCYHHDNLLLGNVVVQPGDLPPSAHWSTEVALLWQGTGILSDFPAEVHERSHSDERSRFDERLRKVRSGMVETLDSLIRRGAKPVPKWGQPDYLGLILYEDTQQVGRSGFDMKIDITSQNSWDLLQLLVTNASRTTSREEFISRGHDEAALRNAKADLARLLRPLKVDIKSVRGVGYRLQESQTTTSTQRKKATSQKKTRGTPLGKEDAYTLLTKR
ncbi:MAG: helix-turn-helix domain-containing protein [Pirellulales bacterium]